MSQEEEVIQVASAGVGTKTYIIKLRKGDRRLTVPARYKITFGPLVPGTKDQGGHAALRIYDGSQQLACMTDVVAFRDASIKLEEKVVKTKRQVVEKDNGNLRRGTVIEARVEAWIDPDEPKEHEADNDGKPDLIEWKDALGDDTF